ncbi:cadherin-like beta sandwich domain-containing protein [Microbacterium hatanonis]|uniref:cadherin-like beta sandwich domain-containing protein n=1 Tax=Microbacterium hatanonis TaxID=404366 RepID=UPI00164F21D9|nr:cadherin-like beta sandwich domain-containing protein [Microbacterium hatanonis]
MTGDKGWSNWRSGTKNTTDTLSYDLAERTQVRHASVQFYRDGGATWPQRLRVEHRLTGGEWSTGSWVDVPAQDAGAPLIDVPLGDVDADEVRVVMEARPATHIVVSEVQIFGLRPSASPVSDLARLTVDGEPVAGFAADTTEYRVVVEGTGWPRLAAIAVDRDAAVRITQPDAGDGTGTVTVTAPDGSERTYTVTIERAGTGPQPSPEPSGPGASPSPSLVSSTSPSAVPNAGGPAASGTGSGALAATGADASIWVAPALLGAAVAAAGVVLLVRRRPRGTAE